MRSELHEGRIKERCQYRKARCCYNCESFTYSFRNVGSLEYYCNDERNKNKKGIVPGLIIERTDCCNYWKEKNNV